jgi:hypothetical protein
MASRSISTMSNARPTGWGRLGILRLDDCARHEARAAPALAVAGVGFDSIAV